MAENVTYHGSAFGDVAEEWHKLPTWGKFAVGGLFIAVASIGYYEFSKSKSSGVTPQGGNAGSLGDLSGAGANQFPTVPGGNTGTVPILPGGICPVFDSSGNLVAFGPCTGATGGTNKPPSTKCPAGMHKGATSGQCKCDLPNMVNKGDHCEPKTSSKKHSGGLPIGDVSAPVGGGSQFQRYHVNERGHMQAVRHSTGVSILQQFDDTSPVIKNHPRIMTPQLR